MRPLVATTLTLFVLGGASLAADRSQPLFTSAPPSVIQSWTSFYLGLNSGGSNAHARPETDASATAGPANTTFTLRESRHGWTVGTGVEVELAPRGSAKLEYRHLDLVRDTLNWPSTKSADPLL
jgi:opacity protein-like surface antigen